MISKRLLILIAPIALGVSMECFASEGVNATPQETANEQAQQQQKQDAENAQTIKNVFGTEGSDQKENPSVAQGASGVNDASAEIAQSPQENKTEINTNQTEGQQVTPPPAEPQSQENTANTIGSTEEPKAPASQQAQAPEEPAPQRETPQTNNVVTTEQNLNTEQPQPQTGNENVVVPTNQSTEETTGEKMIQAVIPGFQDKQQESPVAQPVAEQAQPQSTSAQPEAPVPPVAQPVADQAQQQSTSAQPEAPVPTATQPATEQAQPQGTTAQPEAPVPSVAQPATEQAQPQSTNAQPEAPVPTATQPATDQAQQQSTDAAKEKAAEFVAKEANEKLSKANPDELAQKVDKVQDDIGEIRRNVDLMTVMLANKAEDNGQLGDLSALAEKKIQLEGTELAQSQSEGEKQANSEQNTLENGEPSGAQTQTPPQEQRTEQEKPQEPQYDGKEGEKDQGMAESQNGKNEHLSAPESELPSIPTPPEAPNINVEINSAKRINTTPKKISSNVQAIIDRLNGIEKKVDIVDDKVEALEQNGSAGKLKNTQHEGTKREEPASTIADSPDIRQLEAQNGEHDVRQIGEVSLKQEGTSHSDGSELNGTGSEIQSHINTSDLSKEASPETTLSTESLGDKNETKGAKEQLIENKGSTPVNLEAKANEKTSGTEASATIETEQKTQDSKTEALQAEVEKTIESMKTGEPKVYEESIAQISAQPSISSGYGISKIREDAGKLFTSLEELERLSKNISR